MSSQADAEKLYDQHAAAWSRTNPVMWSDVTARPWVLSALDWTEKRVCDIGCGEGYLSRAVLEAGAASVEGYDISLAMVESARERAADDPRQRFEHADATTMPFSGRFDLFLCVFVANYLTIAQTTEMLVAARAAAASDAQLVLVAPHPSLPWHGPAGAPVRFEPGTHTYQDVDAPLPGTLWRLDGTCVPVTNRHKRLQDWLELIPRAGWSLDQLVELQLTAEDARRHAGPADAAGVPLHLGLRLRAT